MGAQNVKSPSREKVWAEARSDKNIRTAALAGGVGTMLEQFDFAIYGLAAALVFPQVFFPETDPLAGALLSLGGFAIGFFARPFGGVIFAHFGETKGRRWVLVATLALMGTATFLIGCVPSYSSIGVAAPILLFTLRLLQGLGAGAEQSGSATLLTETARLGKRGKLSSSVMVGAAAGTVCGTLIFAVIQWIIPQSAFVTWGWRIVFWFSLLVTVGAWLIRRHLAESPVFTELKSSTAENKEKSAPLVVAVRKGWKRILLVACLNWGPNTQSYTVQTFFVTYVTAHVVINQNGDFFPKSTITDIQLIGAMVGMLSAFTWGLLSDRFGRKPLYAFIAGVGIFMPVVYFNLLDTGSTILVAVAVILGYIFAAYGSVGIQMSYFPELFGTRYRYAGVTVAREISSLIGGGIAPMICAGLLLKYNTWIPLAIYIGFTMLCTFIASLIAPETVDRDMTISTDAVKGEAHSGF